MLWTKTEFLDLAKFKQLIKEGNSRSDAKQQAPEKAWADFQQNILPRFNTFKYPPKGYVVFRSKLVDFLLFHLVNHIVQKCMNLEVIVMS